MAASGRITGKAFNLADLFDRVTYALEYYQREYAWSADDVATLLTDLIEQFEDTDSVRWSRRTPAPQFFLGPFVYSEEGGGRRFLVDGQQRFTTLHLIFLHLLRLIPEDAGRKTRTRLERAIVDGYNGNQPRFRLHINERQKLLEALLEKKPYELEPNATLSVQNLWKRSNQIEEELKRRLDSDRHGRFVDWLLDSVVMIGIEAVDRDNGFRIFESMNDRGARLTSVDLVKSFLLSRANRDVEKLNERWRDMLAEVTRRRGDTQAPTEFLKAFLIAHHADLDASSTDPAEIEHAPHMWIHKHAERIDLRKGDNESYLRFVTQLIDLGRHYATLAAAMIRPSQDDGVLTPLFYNRVNGVKAQAALILAAINPDDTLTTVREKARVAANFVDLLYVSRAVHDDSTRAEDLDREVLDRVPLVRCCTSATELGKILGAELPDLDFQLMRILSLRGDNRAQIRYILARLTAYVEKELRRPDEVDQYLAAERTWQIEHIFADHPERHRELTPLAFRLERRRIGCLGLLPARDNASVNDLPYAEKIEWYRRHTALLAVLAPAHGKRNPLLKTLISSHGLMKTLRDFGTSPSMQEVVDVRGQLYEALAQRVWDPSRLGLVIPPIAPASTAKPSGTPIPPAKARRPRSRSSKPRTPLAGLVAGGRIAPGTRLHGTHRGTHHEIRVDADGRLWLGDADSFRLPDEAGRIVTNLKSCSGYRFWHVTLVDGTSVPLGEFRDDPALVAR